MGKQINFYMDKEVQTKFIEYLELNEFVFLNSDASVVVKIKEDTVFGVYLYKQNYGNLVMSGNHAMQIDSIKSPVIQFRKTIIKQEERKILRGRLWMSHQYYADDGAIIKKEVSLLKDYQMITRWIKKNVPYQKICKGDYTVVEYANDFLIDLQTEGFVFTL